MKTRKELAQHLFYGTGVELGVAGGTFSSVILQLHPPRPNYCERPLGRKFSELAPDELRSMHIMQGNCLTSIDRWTEPHHDIKQYATALALLSIYGERSRVIRSSFTEALVLFPEGSLDFVYIDGYAHTGQEGGQTLREWWPKLKPGGIFSGHDYSPQFQPTIDAVDAFVREHDLRLNLTTEDALPSWWVVKGEQ